MSLLSGNALFLDDSLNCAQSTVDILGLSTFCDTAGNLGIVSTGSFNGSAINSGVSLVASFFGNASNLGVVSTAASFFGSSSNGGTVSGTAIFSETSSNQSEVKQNVIFFGNSVNSGVVQNATFFGTSVNAGVIVESGSFGDSASNSAAGVISGNAIFADTTSNDGTVVGNAEVATTASNAGTVQGSETTYNHPDGYFENGYYDTGVKAAPANYETIVHEVAGLAGSFWYKYDASGNGELASGSYDDGSAAIYSFTNGIKGAFISSVALGRYSYYFDGSSGLIKPHEAVLDISATDFTIENWFKVEGYDESNSFVTFAKGLNYQGYYYGDPSSDQTASVLIQAPLNRVATTTSNGSSAGENNFSSFTATNGVWYHMAIVGEYSNNINTLKIYIDGSLINEYATNDAIGNNNHPLLIGMYGENYPNGLSIGYISNFRLIKGQQLYSGNSFTVPNAPLTATGYGSTSQNITGDVFLLKDATDLTEHGNVLISADDPFDA